MLWTGKSGCRSCCGLRSQKDRQRQCGAKFPLLDFDRENKLLLVMMVLILNFLTYPNILSSYLDISISLFSGLDWIERTKVHIRVICFTLDCQRACYLLNLWVHHCMPETPSQPAVCPPFQGRYAITLRNRPLKETLGRGISMGTTIIKSRPRNWTCNYL